MNFLEIVKGVRGRVGMQGTGPSSVLTATSAEMDLVNAVHDAWVDVQNFREEWRWMRDEVSFSTVIGQWEYTIDQIFSTTADRFKNWRKTPVYALIDGRWSEISFMEYDSFNYRFQNNDQQSYPAFYTIRTWDNTLIINTPDKAYSIKVGYQKAPQLLKDNSDVPELPLSFHLNILYLAVEKYDTVVISGASLTYYQQLNDFCSGQLMRSQLDKKRVRLGGGIA
jgi:hypothetical protein